MARKKQQIAESKPSVNWKKIVSWVFLVVVIPTVLSYFFTPLQEPINNFVIKVIYGEPDLKVYVIRNYPVDLQAHYEEFDLVNLIVEGNTQTVFFTKNVFDPKNNKIFGSSYIDTSREPINYLIFIKNEGNYTAKNVLMYGKLKVNDLKIYNVDSLIDMNPNNVGGLLPKEKTFKLLIQKLEPNEITSLRLSSDVLSNIDLECTLNGKCGVNSIVDNVYFNYQNFPYNLSTTAYKNRLNIFVPDYRNRERGLFYYDSNNEAWVRATDVHENIEIDCSTERL